jgi:hypothetical protein
MKASTCTNRSRRPTIRHTEESQTQNQVNPLDPLPICHTEGRAGPKLGQIGGGQTSAGRRAAVSAEVNAQAGSNGGVQRRRRSSHGWHGRRSNAGCPGEKIVLSLLNTNWHACELCDLKPFDDNV